MRFPHSQWYTLSQGILYKCILNKLQNTGVCMTALLNSKGTDHQHQVTPSTANALSHVHITYCAGQNSGRKNLW